jgi:hypothetical protein
MSRGGTWYDMKTTTTQSAASEIAKKKLLRGWPIISLIVLTVVMLVPSVTAVFLYYVVGRYTFLPLGPAPDFRQLVDVPFLTLAYAGWPFVVLYFVTVSKSQKEWPSVGSVQLAFGCSLGAMTITSASILIKFRFGLINDIAKMQAYLWGFNTCGMCDLAQDFLLLFWNSVTGSVGWFVGRHLYKRIYRG